MDPSPYAGGGAGGKIRRRPAPRSAATPYERPPAAAAAHRLAAAAAAAAASSGPGGEGGGVGGGGGGGWVSRLVDPASRLIAGGAARLFSSVFRKRLAPAPAPASGSPQPPLSSPTGKNTEPKQDLPESTYVDSSPVLEGGIGKDENRGGMSDNKALSEVEHLLMRKTFTRVEFDRLTDLLRARTVESDLSTSVISHEKNKESVKIDGVGGSTSHAVAADDSSTVKVPSLDASSPADLAKQYMSSRYSREPPSSSLRSRLFLENKGEASNTAYDRRSGSPFVQAPVEFGNKDPGLPVNGYVTPGLRGRSAIYRMSRSPYFKGPSSSSNMNMSSLSLSQQAQSSHTGGSQVLKRRGTDLENELGSIGPIRRIRQKSNMMSPFRDARANHRGNVLASRTNEDSSSIQESPSSKRLLLGSGQSAQPLESHKNGGDGKSSENIPPIPPQSNKMAEKIFEQLNIIAPSPKEKQSGQLSVTSNASHSMSKKPLLQDIGPSRTCDTTSSVRFQDMDGANGSRNPDLKGSLLKKDNLKLIKDGSSKVASSDKPTILGNSVSPTTTWKPGFKMAVLEDLEELDDDLEVPGPAKNSSSKIAVETTLQKSDSNRQEQKAEQTILEQNIESNTSRENVAASSGLLSSNDHEKTGTPHTSARSNIGVPPAIRPRTTVSELPLASGKDGRQTDASASIFGLKHSSISELETSTAADVKSEAGLGQSVTKDSTSPERCDKRERTEDTIQSSDKVRPSAASTTLNAPLHFASAASTSPSLTNGFLYSSSSKLSTITATDKPTVSSSPSTTIFAVSSSSPAISSSSPAFPALNFASSPSVGYSMVATAKSEHKIAEEKPASTILFGTGGTTAEAKSTAPDSASKPSSGLLTSPISSNSATFSSSTFSSISPLSSSPVAAFSGAAGSVTTAPSSTSSSAPGVQSASTASLTFSSSGNSIFGFSSPSQSTGLSTSVAGSSSQPSAASAIFGSKTVQLEGVTSQPSQSSVAQFGSPLPTVTSSSGSGPVSFGLGASSTGSGTMSLGVGTSSSAPGTLALGASASSSSPGIFSFGAGTSSSGSGAVSFGVGAGAASSGPATVSFGAGSSSSGAGALSFGAGAASSGAGTMSFGAGASSSGPGTVTFGAGAASSGPGTVSFGAGAASSGPGTVSFGAGAASSGPGTVSFGAGAASSGPGAVSFGAGASSSSPGTVSFGATTSSSGSGFGNSPFGSGATFSNPFSSSSGSAFPFSSPSTSAGSSTAANSVFASTSTASSASAFSSPFGSSSSTPGMFTFGQSASSSSSGGFSFGAQSSPAFSSQPPVFSFTSASASMNSSTPQPAFGMTNTSNTAFGMGSTGNDQMNDDSMADDTNQAAPAPAPIFGSSPFGQQGGSSAAPVFGAPAAQPGGVFQFGGQQQAPAQQNPSFPAAGSLEFPGGNFSLGSGGGGGDKSSRRVIKVKRGPKKR